MKKHAQRVTKHLTGLQIGERKGLKVYGHWKVKRLVLPFVYPETTSAWIDTNVKQPSKSVTMEVIKILPPTKLGIVNVRYKMENMEFDAALDFKHEMHAYELACFRSNRTCEVPIELYNCSKDWDIYMVYPQMSAEDVQKYVDAGVTGTPLETLLESETQQWIDSDPEDSVYIPLENDYDPDEYEDEDLPEVYPVSEADEAEEADVMDNSLPPLPQDDFYEYLDRYGSGAFTVAIVEMLKSGELKVTWEQARALWERGGKIS